MAGADFPGCRPPGGKPWGVWADPPGCRLPKDMANKQAVCILLECILVFHNNVAHLFCDEQLGL